MRLIFLLFISNYFLFAFSFKTFEADFLQSVKNEDNKLIKYSGKIYLNEKANVLWKYKKPFKKDVLIRNNNVYIIDYELEQVIIKVLKEDLSLFDIMKKAKKESNNLYKATVNKKDFFLKVFNNVLEEIFYKDNFDNQVKIKFKKQKINETLRRNIFNLVLPNDFEVIK